MSRVSIRPATSDDQAVLFPLVKTFATSFTTDEARFRVSFSRLVVDASTCLLVAEAGTLVGYLLGFVHDTFYANGPVGWVEEVMVNEGWRRQGIGLKLLR